METLSLLLIEDDLIDQMAFQSLVEHEQLNYDYSIASTVREAAQLLNHQSFDIIISDYNLSDGTAIDVLTLQKNIPVIIVTGAGNETVAVTAMKAGAYDYLTKDSHRRYLTLLPIVVENALRRSSAEREAKDLMKERIRREALHSFLRDASHDLRTPLTTMSMALYLINQNARQLRSLPEGAVIESALLHEISAKIEDRCQVLLEHKNRLQQIILDMLEMVQIDEHNSLDLKAVNFNLLIRDIVRLLEESALQKSQTLTFNPHWDMLVILGNRTELETLVRNLLKNAIIYTPENGCITLSTHLQETMAVLSVMDTGIGIEASHLPYIFDRFYRVDSARTTSDAGSGLGLSIVKRIVELHNGRIEVESTPQQGSTFRVLLPVMHG